MNLQKINEDIEYVENSEEADIPLQKIRSKSLDFEFEEAQEDKRRSDADITKDDSKNEKTEQKRGIFSSFFGKIFSRSKKERSTNKLEQKEGDQTTPHISILEQTTLIENLSD